MNAYRTDDYQAKGSLDSYPGALLEYKSSSYSDLMRSQSLDPLQSQTTISIERLLFACINVAIERLVFQKNFLIQYQLCILSRQILYKKIAQCLQSCISIKLPHLKVTQPSYISDYRLK